MVHTADRLCNGIIDIHILKTQNFDCDKEPFFYNPRTKIYVSFVGYLNNLQEIRSRCGSGMDSCAKIIEYFYSQSKLDFVAELDGIFLVLIYDEKEQKCYIFQPEMGFNLPVYYTYTENDFIISTSLKSVLKEMPAKRELNSNAVRDFLHFEYMIPNESTLIKDVHKLVPGRYIEVDCQKHSFDLKYVPSVRKQKRIAKAIAKAHLVDSIEASIGNLVKQLKTKCMAMTLTAGWDTNLILFCLRKLVSGTIKTATIRGGRTKNEVTSAERILKNNYENVEQITSTVKANIIDSLPEILWRYEGYLFQEGMFLRYELAKTLNRKKYSIVFLGTCADQILFTETAFKQWLRKVYHMRNPVRALRRSIKKTSSKVRYTILIDYNLKMHELMLNSFDIQGIYPFVNRETARLSESLGIFLGWRKRYYKVKLKEMLGPSITRYITKSGDLVDTEEIFNKHKELLMKIMKSTFVRMILRRKQIRRILRNPGRYHLFIIQLAYIYLFNELFVSGRFDSLFDNPCLRIPLSDFLGEV